MKTGRKRGNSEGHIAKWRGRYRATLMVSGRRHWVYGKTRSEAAEKLDVLKLRLRRGDDIRSGAGTLKAQGHSWLEYGRLRWASSTYSNYESAFRLHLNPLIGDRRVDTLTPQVVQTAYARLSANGLTVDTVYKCHKALRACMEQAVKQRVISINPCMILPIH